MTNFFEQALGDVGKLEEDLLGPDYSYYSQIKSPGQMGMGSKGDTKTLEKDIDRLSEENDNLRIMMKGKNE